MATVAILIPAMRPHRLPDAIASIQESTSVGEYRIVVIASGQCAEVAKTLGVTLIEDEGGTYPERINKGFAATNEPWVVLAADDLKFHPGWLEAVTRKMEPLDGVVATNDKHNYAGTHFAVSRNYINTMGGYKDALGIVLFPGFFHQYCDDALRLTARNRGKFAMAEDAITEHLHPGAGKAPTDEVYALGESVGGHDCQIYRDNAELWV